MVAASVCDCTGGPCSSGLVVLGGLAAVPGKLVPVVDVATVAPSVPAVASAPHGLPLRQRLAYWGGSSLLCLCLSLAFLSAPSRIASHGKPATALPAESAAPPST